MKKNLKKYINFYFTTKGSAKELLIGAPLRALNRIEKINRESAFDKKKKKKKPGLKFNPRLALTGVRTTGP